MKDMQDVFRAMLRAINYPYPHVDIIESEHNSNSLIMPKVDQEKLNMERISAILREAVEGPISYGIHENDWWEFRYNKNHAKDIPIQFLKIFEIYWGIPSNQQGWCQRFIQWVKGLFQ
jgi:hypothetical protein